MPILVWKYENSFIANYKFVTKEDADLELQLKKYECRNEKADVWLTDERPTKKDERYDEWYIDNVRCFKPDFLIEEEIMLDDENRNYADDDGEDYYDLISKICFD